MIYKKDTIDMSLVQCPYEEENGYIYIEDEYTNNILKLSGYNEIDDIDFQTMCMCASSILESRLYGYALKSTFNAYYYSRHVHRGRFELGEPTIATDAECAYFYARDVLKGRFELGEATIANDAHHSYYYAHDVLKGRFELGETAIANDSYYSYRYAQGVLKGRFELGENAISTVISCKLNYEKLIGIRL